MAPSPIPSTHSLHVVLVEPEIPWNSGNIGRTCLAAGAHLHLIRPLGFSLAEHRLRRAGLDYWQHVQPQIWSGWPEFESILPGLGRPYFFSGEGQRDYWQPTYPAKTVLIFGSESRGLSPPLRQRYHQRLVSIPMLAAPVRSLNLSTAAALAVYEVQRQRQSPPLATPRDG